MNPYVDGANIIVALGTPRVIIGADAGQEMTRAVHAVNSARPMSVRQARNFIDEAVAMLERANREASGAAAQPGERARRDDLAARLRSMRETLEPLDETAAVSETPVDVGGSFGTTSPGQIVREAVVQAIILYNAAAESSATIRAAREQFFRDIEENARALPAAAAAGAKKVVDSAGKLVDDVKFYGKVTFWVALGAVGLLGYGGYRLLSSQGASNVLGAYLGHRRR